MGLFKEAFYATGSSEVGDPISYIQDETIWNNPSKAGSPQVPLPPPSVNPPEIHELDKNTPDGHVPRDPRMIRLTGAHPFNAEPAVPDLFKQGFLTPPELFFVRNHGPVPVIETKDLDWEISIGGLVENPITINLRDIISEFEQLTAPVTFVCAGNRRKEQNVIRKSKGFSWGAGGLSTALFTGPLMWSIISKAKPLRKGKYVCMEGADELPNGHYGTSVKLSWVKDPSRGIMLAYKMNGEALRPDHGWPLRAVIPGQIGGRSVKWLKKLTISEAPSDNWYHIYDNRVLPTMVTPEMAGPGSKWWLDERYAIYDLSVNSSIAHPQHDEKLAVSSASSYDIKGYAYGGGGRRITRVDISLDNAKSWQLANVEYPEDLYRETEGSLYGGQTDLSWRDGSFCWSFWSLKVEMSELEASDSILVRAMDEAMNIQPRDMYWSVLGMLNNPWFRIKIHKEDGVLRFEHPTQPTLQGGGWMERVKKEGGNLLDGYWGETPKQDTDVSVEEEPSISLVKPGLDVPITVDEFKSHKKFADHPWFVVDGQVYDGTSYLQGHPGGAQSILSAASTDATDEFLAIHSETAREMMKDYHIGTLSGSLGESKKSTSAAPKVIQWSKATLDKRIQLSHDTYLFHFTIPHGTKSLDVGQHVMLRLPESPDTPHATVMRAYTPVSEPTEQDKLDLLVKLYRPTPTAAGGKMSLAFDRLSIGATVDFKNSPSNRFKYLGKGEVILNGIQRSVQSIYMVCGGSGITPMFQVLRAIMRDEGDTTHCTVLDGNRLEEDIMCRAELESFAANDKMNKCKIVHTLTQPPLKGWAGYKGRISGELLDRYVVREPGSLVLLCGPMNLEQSVRSLLIERGWDEGDLFHF